MMRIQLPRRPEVPSSPERICTRSQNRLATTGRSDTLSGIALTIGQPGALVRKMRLAAGLSQRALASRAGTSQPAIVRYERGAAAPSWSTLQRLAEACGQRIEVSSQAVPEPHDIELAERLLELTPEERLRALGRYARLREIAEERS